MEPCFVVVISSGNGLNSDALFTTARLTEAAQAVGAIQTHAPAVNAAVYQGCRCVLRVRNGRWTVPVPTVVAA
jgi:hypothetical protein